MTDEHADEPARPVLRVVRGSPDDAEIAALTTALAAVAASNAGEPERDSGLSMWADRAASLRYPGGRRPLRPGPNGWRSSALPI
ncbi:hypothetical protein FHX42_004279 [Saccharopolyspora lacisalsi]|uniref:Acyl-CoA carboxylase epsilon subunit-like protein n=1 Tax=Halosaccharopolyspora lacisalsi TaxID=1000566 RepID=A0A839E1D6_9PSEU|nr:acyl-CoA carboxylase subunit epsilon [Halosaccharopolyspora lacisalsi]MBA8826900.1 hypothetical protein [Halosaccharopolyspora lacisalsi]